MDNNYGEKAEQRKFEHQKRQQKRKIIIISIISFVLVCCIIAALIILMPNLINKQQNAQAQSISTKENNANIIEIPLSELTNEMKFYSYMSDNGIGIQYFALIGSDEQPHIALNACDSCYPAKKGYRQNDETVICNLCGNKYRINSIGSENITGGCWPSYLPMKIEKNKIIIEIENLKEKEYMFE